MTASTDSIHATTVAIGGRGIVLIGPSGAGKSDLALRLIDRGATLVADDRTIATARDGRLWLAPPAPIRGLIEVRGLGILTLPFVESCAAALVVDLAHLPERLPEAECRPVRGIALPLVRMNAFHASAPIRVEQALARLPLVD